MNLGTAQVIRANSRHLPLADNSVDLVVTSPPYFALRSYQDGGEHYAGQIGDEPTPAAFVASLLEVTAECVRVLKPSGSLWVNLGDKYAGGRSGPQGETGQRSDRAQAVTYGTNVQTFQTGVRHKSLIGIPWRYALACIDDLGLILRAEVIWSKPNGLPESVTDRVRRSHEQWFHFTLSPRYFSAVDEIREAPSENGPAVTMRRVRAERASGDRDRIYDGYGGRKDGDRLETAAPNPLGKLPGSVWTGGDGTSTMGLVLRAVADGHLTPDEGERLLWDGRTNSGPRSTNPATAGDGSVSSTATATAATGTPTRATDAPTDSSTSYASDPSLTDSTSTISAETSGASTPTTSSPSPTPRTPHASPARTPARSDTSTTRETRTSDATASESVEPAWQPGCGSAGGSDSPPSVWQIPTEPLRVPDHLGVDHFAAFPTEWPKRIIQGWSPAGVCVACGEGRRPVGDRERVVTQHAITPSHKSADNNRSTDADFDRKATLVTITGYACACPHPTADTRPAVILDPFGGTGTVAMVAKALGRHGITVDMSADYCRLAEWRTNDRNQLAKVLGVAKAEQQPADQAGLFDLDGGAA